VANRNFVVKNGLTVGNITLNASNSNVITTGNVTANFYIGNGSLLTGISTTPLTVALSNATGGNVTNSIASVSTLKFDSTSGFGVTDLGSGNALITLGSTFKTWQVTGQPSLVAVGEDTVQFIAGTGITITTSNTSNPKSITFNSTGGGGGSGANVTVDDFTGNGVQTTFQLSTTPGNINQTSVNYNGVTLLRNSYTLSGANITFVSPPANGAQIEVSTLQAGNSSPGIPGGSNTQLQYNANGSFGGIPNVTFNGSNLSLGNVANINITGGSNGQALTTDGNGILTWSTVAGSPGGFNTYVQFNDSGNFAGSSRFLFNKLSNTLTVSNVTVLGAGNTLSFQNAAGNKVSLAAPTNIAANVSFTVPNTVGTTQQVLGVIADGASQTLGWKTVPTYYVTVNLRNGNSYLSSPNPVLRQYPIRLRSGSFLNVSVTE